MSEWRTIPSFPLYEASDEGEIRRIRPYYKTVAHHILKPSVTKSGITKRGSGYLFATVRAEGRSFTRTFHTLICEAFHGEKPSPLHHAAHENGNRSDNRPANLFWKLPVENEADKRRHGTLPLGSKHHAARFTEEQIIEVRRRYSELPRSAKRVKNGALADFADDVGVSKTGLYQLLGRSRSWRHL